MIRNLTKLSTTVALALVLPLATATGASASGTPTQTSAAQVEATTQAAIDAPAPEEGSLFDTVANAATEDEKREILVAEGFEQVSGEGERYEKTVDGVTLGWSIDTSVDPGTIQPMWSVGWSSGPYVAATVSQWQSAASTGTSVGALACGFIANVWGGIGCAAAGLAVSEAIDAYDPGAVGSTCMAAKPTNPITVFPVSSC
ncbi:hypothetical protein GCM10009618_00370 [Nesterenkonia lacusekhoensis]